MAVWIVSRTGLVSVANTNAVALNLGDADARDKLTSLTRMCAVLLTRGSKKSTLPIAGQTIRARDLDLLADEVRSHQSHVTHVFYEYKIETGKHGLTGPVFPEGPSQEVPNPANTPSDRALAAATAFGRLWAYWLQSDAARLQAVGRGSAELDVTGVGDFDEADMEAQSGFREFAPAELRSDVVPDFPSRFAATLNIQSLV